MGVLLLFLLLSGPLRAQHSPLSAPLNSKEPIKITADAMDADNLARTFVFKGNVKVVQGQTVITSEKLKVWYKGDGDPSAAATEGAPGSSRIRDIEAEGDVVILFDGRTAKSDKALYSADRETLTLLGRNATIIDGKNTISGAKITLYRAEDRITVEGTQKERVEAFFFPDEADKNN
jgi:lipopolysaccharide export system protein LptA